MASAEHRRASADRQAERAIKRYAVALGRDALRGRTVWLVNSTPAGGGVAELLRTVTPNWLDAGVDAHWAVLGGGPAFLRITKRIHNLLHGHPGDDGQLGSLDRAIADMLADPERRRRLGEAAHEQVRTRLMPDRHLAAWMRLLAELGR